MLTLLVSAGRTATVGQPHVCADPQQQQERWRGLTVHVDLGGHVPLAGCQRDWCCAGQLCEVAKPVCGSSVSVYGHLGASSDGNMTLRNKD